MNFNYSSDKVQLPITKEFLLSKNSEETYMSYYLGMPLSNKAFCSPLRKDHKPSCSLWKSKLGTLYFKDFATGQTLSFVNLVMVKYNCTYSEALIKIAEDFGLTPEQTNLQPIIQQIPTFKTKSQSKIQIEQKKFTKQELAWWKQFGITKEILDKFSIFSCKNVFLNNKIFITSTEKCPVYGYFYGIKNGIEQWKIYIPLRTKFRWINNADKETTQGYAQLPETGKYLVITKSLKDVALLYTFGIPAVAPSSETSFIKKELLEELKNRFQTIIVFFDNDRTGKAYMAKLRHKYPEFKYLIIPRQLKAKDISDFYKLYGRKLTKDLIKKGLKIISK
ncbi:MAG TPA: toprim domain-containing protein [Bacteroidales bacterium]|nr:toprim domain-containing protein [Bacteroidales bacterium]